jgi:flagellar biosynthesis protein FlhF
MAALPRQNATLLAFPGAGQNQHSGAIAAALRRHRLPERLTAQLLRATAGASDPQAALARALASRMTVEPLDLSAARPILLIGASGAGKSRAAAAIATAATAMTGREVLLLTAREGLAQLRAGMLPRHPLVVMEAEGFHPLNPKARGAFAALSDMGDVLAVGVVSAAGDAEDVAETVAACRFRRLIVTGLDRTRRLGALAAAAAGGARLAHLVRGGALETLSPADLAAGLLAPA